MSKVYVAPILSVALEKFKEIVAAHAECAGREGKRLVVFCEDRLSLVAERAVCDAVGGTFSVGVYTLSRFLTAEAGACDNVLTSQGSAMAVRKLIEKNREDLQLFKRLSAANAAQEVYDTIALLYSSKISADDLSERQVESRLLKRKLHDLELLYRAYSEYLKEHGAVDRNAYLRRLPDLICSSEKIKGADVVFLGFQAFTSSVVDCVRASMRTADDVYGIFVGGSYKKYVNEAWTSFINVAVEEGLCTRTGTGFYESVPPNLTPAAEHMRRYAFEPESFHKSVSLGIVRGQLNVCEAADEDEESRFIASQVLKCVKEDGVRYREISVMFPDINAVQPALERAFAEYEIPIYVDRRYPLASHSLCSFVLDYLACVADGCTMESVFSVISSPVFTLAGGENAGNLSDDKDFFVNYCLRAASYRGAVRRVANREICDRERGLDFAAVERVRKSFIAGLDALRVKGGDGAALCRAVRDLLALFGVEKRLSEMAANAEKCALASVAEMSRRAYGEVLSVIAEAEKLIAGDKLSVREFAKILKSGFVAAEVSLIQPKQDAVFVSDLSACANAGSKIIFAGGLTDAVPAASQDTAILTDGELTSLEKLKLAVSPKISQVNRRTREITALNLCAFSEKLYLSYPLRSGGEECGVSEIIGYIRHLFNVGGSPVQALPIKALSVTEENFAYTCARPVPARRLVDFYLSGDRDYGEKRVAAVYSWLNSQNCGDKREDGAVLEKGGGGSLADGDRRALYGESVSPTALETYFSCPYKAFLQNGLRIAERREGAFRPMDSGNFIHAVLERVAGELNGIDTAGECAEAARRHAEEMLKEESFLVSEEDGRAKYTAGELIKEAQTVAVGTFEQIKNSRFKVEEVEKTCRLRLDGGLIVGGRIDRVDVSDDLVRVVDYKTGGIDDTPSSYYMGLKLQLPLYLLAASEGRRAAGAYYFPANIEYSSDGAGAFTLRGFMDGGEEVVRRSDTVVEEKCKSAYVGAYLNGRALDKAMTTEDFSDFLQYSRQIASLGAEQLLKGKIAPSPVKDACSKCSFKGCCGYDAEKSGEREAVPCDCKTIAKIARSARGENESGEDEV